MPRSWRTRSRTAGLPPGTLVPVKDKGKGEVRIRILDYDKDQVREVENATVEECIPFKESSAVTWINVDGLHDVPLMEKLGAHFGLHPLILEDIVNTGLRPKIEDLGEFIFIVATMVRPSEAGTSLVEQISLIVGKTVVLSFQEAQGDVFDPVRERIRTGNGRIRKMGADFLAYALLDSLVDNYFVVLDRLGEALDTLEERVVRAPAQATLNEIHAMKKQLVILRRFVWPLREVIGNLWHWHSPLIRKSTEPYLKDVYDNVFEVVDTIESFREITSGLLDAYLSSISNRTNEVMKVLTIIATIFIPLTFIAGVYGMNFKFMPELDWKLGYAMAWAIMVAVAVAMGIYFRRKKWL